MFSDVFLLVSICPTVPRKNHKVHLLLPSVCGPKKAQVERQEGIECPLEGMARVCFFKTVPNY